MALFLDSVNRQRNLFGRIGYYNGRITHNYAIGETASVLLILKPHKHSPPLSDGVL